MILKTLAPDEARLVMIRPLSRQSCEIGVYTLMESSHKIRGAGVTVSHALYSGTVGERWLRTSCLHYV